MNSTIRITLRALLLLSSVSPSPSSNRHHSMPTSSWELYHPITGLTIRAFPIQESGNVSRLISISDALCELTRGLKIKTTCCISFLLVFKNLSRALNFSEKLLIWSHKLSLKGPHCVRAKSYYQELQVEPETLICQALHCHLVHQKTKDCREGCVHCDSPCLKRYLPWLYFGW